MNGAAVNLVVPLERAVERFWANVEKGGADDCWPWTGYLYKTGYGGTEFSGKPIYAHRLAWIVHYGPITGSLEVLHSCDNPPCCNHAHLFLGTQLDNIADMNAKGRGAAPPIHRGEANPKATLTDAQVAELRLLAAGGNLKQRDLAARFGVSQSTVCRLIHQHTRAAA